MPCRSPRSVLDLLLALAARALGQARLEDAHRHGAVLQLRPLVLARGGDAGGRWVMRTAESVVFTDWPPGPDER